MLMKHFQEVCEPYDFTKENATTGEIEVIRKLSDCINEDKSLMKYVKTFISQRQEEDVDEDEDCDDDSSDDEDVCENLNSEL